MGTQFVLLRLAGRTRDDGPSGCVGAESCRSRYSGALHLYVHDERGSSVLRKAVPTAPPGWRQEDRTSHRHHAGEPIVRSLLQHLPGGDRAPDEGRQTLTPASPTPSRARAHRSVPRQQGPRDYGGPRDSRASRAETSTAARWTASSVSRLSTRVYCSGRSRPPKHVGGTAPTLSGITTRGNPKLLDLCVALHAAGPAVAPDLMDVARPPLPRIRVVGAVCSSREPGKLRELRRSSSRSKRARGARTPRVL